MNPTILDVTPATAWPANATIVVKVSAAADRRAGRHHWHRGHRHLHHERNVANARE